MTATKGQITASASTATVLAPSYTFNTAAGDTATIATILGDSGGASTVTKNGAGTGALSGTNTYTGATTINAGTLRLSSFARQAFLTGSSYADVKGGQLQVNYTGGTSPQSTIVPILTANAPTNFASGLVRSSTASATRGLGWIDDTVNSNFTVKATYKGDTNLDGQVDVTDLGALATNWQTASNWVGGDFNYDGFVDVTDLGILATNWQAGVGNPLGAGSFQDALASVGLGGVTVPEPATIGVLGLCLTVASARRRRR